MLTLKIQQVDVFGDDGNPVDANGMIFFKIVEQSGFVYNQGYTASNGVTFMPKQYPHYVPNYPCLFVRGIDKSQDDKTICVTRNDFLKIQEAIEQLLKIHNKQFLKTVTFLYANGRRYKINVTKETDWYIEGSDCDDGLNSISTYFKGDIKDLEVLEDSFQKKTTNLYNFYYSAKQADHYSKVNSRGGHFDAFDKTRWKHWINRINGQPYTACSKVGVDHGCGWDDIKLITTAEFSKVINGPDYW